MLQPLQLSLKILYIILRCLEEDTNTTSGIPLNDILRLIINKNIRLTSNATNRILLFGVREDTFLPVIWHHITFYKPCSFPIG